MERNAEADTAADQARELALLVDVLLPGDGQFPPAAAVGAHDLLAERLREQMGSDAVTDVLAGLQARSSGNSLADLDPAARIAAVASFERAEPELFATVRSFLYYSYYQSPLIVAAIRTLGIAYNDAPQPLGYPLAPFDPTPGTDAPSRPRGTYKTTEAVTRIEILPWAAQATRSEQ